MEAAPQLAALTAARMPSQDSGEAAGELAPIERWITRAPAIAALTAPHLVLILIPGRGRVGTTAVSCQRGAAYPPAPSAAPLLFQESERPLV